MQSGKYIGRAEARRIEAALLEDLVTFSSEEMIRAALEAKARGADAAGIQAAMEEAIETAIASARERCLRELRAAEIHVD